MSDINWKVVCTWVAEDGTEMPNHEILFSKFWEAAYYVRNRVHRGRIVKGTVKYTDLRKVNEAQADSVSKA